MKYVGLNVQKWFVVYITKIPEKVNTAMYFSGRPCAVQLYIVHNFDILM